jgi:hypothetical protein
LRRRSGRVEAVTFFIDRFFAVIDSDALPLKIHMGL